MGRLSRSALVLGVVVLVLAAGGAYALASSSAKGPITVCVRHHGGTLYQARKCAKHDAKLSWNKQGPAGPTGATGAPGSTGQQGPPGPITGALPSGVTLRGLFSISFYATAGTGESQSQPISFGLQLASPPTVHLVTGAVPSGCSGTYSNPGADPGNLCIFVSTAEGNLVEVNPLTSVQNSATTFGGSLTLFSLSTTGGYFASGTWAVTG